MNCPNCHKEILNEDAMFCAYCQQPIGGGQPQAFQPSIPQQPMQPIVYCSSCGNPCHPNAAICIRCGCSLGRNTVDENDEPSTGIKVASFFIPLLGFILYGINISAKPRSAKAYGKMAIIGMVVSLIFGFFFGLISSLLMAEFY